jgi:hypothetical protein
VVADFSQDFLGANVISFWYFLLLPTFAAFDD